MNKVYTLVNNQEDMNWYVIAIAIAIVNKDIAYAQ